MPANVKSRMSLVTLCRTSQKSVPSWNILGAKGRVWRLTAAIKTLHWAGDTPPKIDCLEFPYDSDLEAETLVWPYCPLFCPMISCGRWLYWSGEEQKGPYLECCWIIEAGANESSWNLAMSGGYCTGILSSVPIYLFCGEFFLSHTLHRSLQQGMWCFCNTQFFVDITRQPWVHKTEMQISVLLDTWLWDASIQK